MHLTPSDPDIATIYRKIVSGRLDLQPNFQRGEVWGKAKKQRLIDSVLRKWHIPPIHVIQPHNGDKQEVLDGQQRLAAIRDFMDGEFSVNGNQEPLNEEIQKLQGLHWEQLPPQSKSQFEDFTIRILTISDYKADEPGELFYRLNQPTNLTSAEQRNAYFGEARQQIKDLADFMQEIGFDSAMLGFSNSRMAYDDVLSKFLLTLELNTLKKKITASTVTARYRDNFGFDETLLSLARESLVALKSSRDAFTKPLKLNKASFLTWLIFIARYKSLELIDHDLEIFFDFFESARKNDYNHLHHLPLCDIDVNVLDTLFDLYQDRSSSRVADTSSVILRDISLWICYVGQSKNQKVFPELKREVKNLNSVSSAGEDISDKTLESIASRLNWGIQL